VTRFWREMTLEALGEPLGITRERAWQIESDGMTKVGTLIVRKLGRLRQ
jgi:DNA-directed RNA polymerase sigma subunit (sigma70/sigma32)